MAPKLVSARATPQPRLRAQTSSDSRDFCSVETRSSSSTSMSFKVKHDTASLRRSTQVADGPRGRWPMDRGAGGPASREGFGGG